MYQIVEPLAYYLSELKGLIHGHTIGRFGKPTAPASPWQNGFAAEGEKPGRRCSVATILLRIDWLSDVIGALLW
jgi:hypothetical protein